MTQFFSQILLIVSLITTGSALRCYHCLPSHNLTSTGGPSCIPKQMTCGNETHCLSMRRQFSRGSELTYKSCAGEGRCVSAHAVCVKLKNSSLLVDEDCVAHCCQEDLCNIHVHKNEKDKNENSNAKHKGNNGKSSLPLPPTALLSSLMMLRFCLLT